ncbi:glutamate--tRNA ligase family protein [Shigella sp. FC1967]
MIGCWIISLSLVILANMNSHVLISDALENITHSLCTLEFQDNRRFI